MNALFEDAKVRLPQIVDIINERNFKKMSAICRKYGQVSDFNKTDTAPELIAKIGQILFKAEKSSPEYEYAVKKLMAEMVSKTTPIFLLSCFFDMKEKERGQGKEVVINTDGLKRFTDDRISFNNPVVIEYCSNVIFYGNNYKALSNTSVSGFYPYLEVSPLDESLFTSKKMQDETSVYDRIGLTFNDSVFVPLLSLVLKFLSTYDILSKNESEIRDVIYTGASEWLEKHRVISVSSQSKKNTSVKEIDIEKILTNLTNYFITIKNNAEALNSQDCVVADKTFLKRITLPHNKTYVDVYPLHSMTLLNFLSKKIDSLSFSVQETDKKFKYKKRTKNFALVKKPQIFSLPMLKSGGVTVFKNQDFSFDTSKIKSITFSGKNNEGLIENSDYFESRMMFEIDHLFYSDKYRDVIIKMSDAISKGEGEFFSYYENILCGRAKEAFYLFIKKVPNINSLTESQLNIVRTMFSECVLDMINANTQTLRNKVVTALKEVK